MAFHEAGHAVAAWFLKYAEPLLKVSFLTTYQIAWPWQQSSIAASVLLQSGDSWSCAASGSWWPPALNYFQIMLILGISRVIAFQRVNQRVRQK